MTTVGIPVMYYGEEVGRKGGDWPDNRSDMPWGEHDIRPGDGIPRDEALRADVARLVAIRRAHPALSRGGYQELSSDGDLLVFLRDDPGSGDAVLVAVNRGEAAAKASVELPAALADRALVDPLGGPPPLDSQGHLELQVGPLSARIITVGDGHNGGA
jgi:glycosidase